MPNSLRYIIITVLASILFFPLLGQVHLFDWDEINFAECAREMLVTGDYMGVKINYLPFWEKPPLFIWMQAIAMKMFGVNEYAARFPNAFLGVITLLCLFYIGKRIVNEKMATWWVLLYAATWLPHFYFKSGIIDPTFNLFIFLSFFQVHLMRFGSRRLLHALLAGLFLGLAVMTKGPVAVLVAVLSFGVYLIFNRGLSGYKIVHLFAIALAAFITTFIWFGIDIVQNGGWFVREFIVYQIRLFRTEDADHGGPFFYHFIVLLLGCFPASAFLFQYSRTRASSDNIAARDFNRWMWIMFWVVLLLFSIVKTKIVHYSSLCYFPLTYLAALQLYRLGNEQYRVKNGVRILLLVIGSLVAIAIALLPVVGINKDKLIPYIDDPFAVGNFEAAVNWSYAESLWGLLYLIGIWISIMLMKKKFRRGMVTLCVLQLLIIQVTVLHFTPKIEAFSQRAAIDYFKSFRGKDVYVHVLGYKSYAHLFYTAKQPPTNDNSYNEEWLLNGPVDKPTFFICKITEAHKYQNQPQLEQISAKNGFVFFKRK
jgi:4-amino-4-deoxy-L-arabinose transferase-like glycosyltransferase